MKDPFLKFKYAQGLGDLIKSFLQSKFIHPITEFFVKNSKSCKSCNNRAWALNVLFPIPFWKLFFKTIEEMEENLKKDLLEYGYELLDENEEKNECNDCNKEDQELITTLQNEIFILKEYMSKRDIENYEIVSESETNHESIKIVTLLYKKID